MFCKVIQGDSAVMALAPIQESLLEECKSIFVGIDDFQKMGILGKRNFSQSEMLAVVMHLDLMMAIQSP